ncbi:uncharacterized protein KY384_005697 [Bacidia gigantensis]|uniref:uncharacterized protein n=1 Tax=Bacidia gigantensis TaxID=2732470 RepID=UPI001D048800|nr:uncharacterized protein KY384_005697 [Bacidia gigantensis]KAG8529062.1 hypothetical protein KY384_005697 [Bacidia gigantensis]
MPRLFAESLATLLTFEQANGSSISDGPISAFAAKRATHTPKETSHVLSEQIAPPAQHEVEDPRDSPEPPRKKRRKQNRSEVRDSISAEQVQDSPIVTATPPTEHGLVIYPTTNVSLEQGFDAEEEESLSLTSDETSPAIQDRSISSFVPSDANILENTSTQWTVHLSPKDTLGILGQYDLWVRKGAVGIAGAVLRESPELRRVFAPSTHAIPIIRPIPDPFGSRSQGAEVTIRSCGVFGMEETKTHMQIDDLSSMDDYYKRPLRSLQLPQPSLSIVRHMIDAKVQAKPLEILVCGPKASGKSTMSRWLLNALLSASQTHRLDNSRNSMLYFLDLDPGQPEFSPPGEISLLKVHSHNLGVPFTHPTPPPRMAQSLRSHYVGSMTPRDDPRHFQRCTSNLLQTYRGLSESEPGATLLINSAGWIQGRGYDLLMELLSDLRATDIIYTSTTGPDDVIEGLVKACDANGTQLHQVASQPFPDEANTASDLRAMQSLSYFHLAESEAGNLRWNSQLLMEMPPMLAPYSGPKQCIFAAMILGEYFNPDFLVSILDGSTVGLVLIENDLAIDSLRSHPTYGESGSLNDGINSEESLARKGGIQSQMHSAIRRSPDEIPYLQPEQNTAPLLPECSRSLGQALIRSIDLRNKVFHLYTPVSASELQRLHFENRKIILARGRLDIPAWAYKEELEYEKSLHGKGHPPLGFGKGPSKDKTSEESEINGLMAEMQNVTRKQPWVSVVERGRSKDPKARRVRRDIRYKGQVKGDT